MEGDSRNPRVSLLKKYDIPIDHLSFEYIESCKDRKELERIVRILRSGEEGTYPDLLKTCENQLKTIAPDSRVLRVESPALTKESFTNEEWKTLEKDLLSWEEEMNVMDKSLSFEKQRFDTIGNKNLPEVRKIVEKGSHTKKASDATKIKIETNNKNQRIKSGDYAAWDKFDVDKELLKMDIEEERIQDKNARIKREMEKKKEQVKTKVIEPINIDKDSYSNMEQQILANQAKDRGNECFKSKDYENALKYYNLSLKLYVTANVYNNRAMTYIKMGSYDEALKDCNEVLKRERNNVKALHRRATAYQNLPGDINNELALKDLLHIISLEPTNTVAQSDLQSLKKKLNLQSVGNKYRMKIDDENKSDVRNFVYQPIGTQNKSSWKDDDDINAIRKLPLTYYGPSTSTFQCQPQSMTHRMLSGPTFSSEVMCKCNNRATRQNPLCYRCGEEASRPKPRPKLLTKSVPENVIKEKSEEKSKNEGLVVQTAIDVGSESRTGEIEEGNKSKSEDNDVKMENKDKVWQNEINVEIKSKFDPVQEIKTLVAEVEKTDIKKELSDNDKSIKSEHNIEFCTSESLPDIMTGDKNGNSVADRSVNDKDTVNIINNNEVENSAAVECNNVREVKEKRQIKKDSFLFQELDKSLKERKNKNNEQYKDLANQAGLSDKNLFNGQENSWRSISVNEKPKQIVESNVNKTDNSSHDKSANNNDNQCLPSSYKNESKKAIKKSKSKKKKHKESGEDEKLSPYSKPGGIALASKYSNPTSVEPKYEVSSRKENTNKGDAIESQSQFKTFIPNKKCLSTESGILKSTAVSYPSNMKDRGAPNSQTSTNSEKIDGDSNSEGNKENIENRNECSTTVGSFKQNSADNGFKIDSSFQFVKSWESMKKSDETYEKRAEIIRSLRPEDLKTVIGNNLDSDLLKSILECLEKHFLDNDPKKVTSILRELPGIPRFAIVNLFLDRTERRVIDRLIEQAEMKGFILDSEVKKSFQVSF